MAASILYKDVGSRISGAPAFSRGVHGMDEKSRWKYQAVLVVKVRILTTLTSNVFDQAKLCRGKVAEKESRSPPWRALTQHGLVGSSTTTGADGGSEISNVLRNLSVLLVEYRPFDTPPRHSVNSTPYNQPALPSIGAEHRYRHQLFAHSPTLPYSSSSIDPPASKRTPHSSRSSTAPISLPLWHTCIIQQHTLFFRSATLAQRTRTASAVGAAAA